jgi:hypothetical protein
MTSQSAPPDPTLPPSGEDARPVVTFYSYKGGVGRSMALANLAVLLARDYDREVIVVDWDLEAPGLHRFFGLADTDVTDGVIDYLHRYKANLRSADRSTTERDLALEPALIDVRRYDNGGRVRLLGAGNLANHAEYVRRVGAFDWDDFYREWNGAQLIELIRNQLKTLATVSLIDSRTGITDVGGVCTLQLPDLIVFVFSFNEQNISGTEWIARDLATDNPTLEKLGRRPEILLLPSRKELGQIERLRHWEKVADTRLGGYVTRERIQPRFTDTLAYIRDASVQYIPYFAYGEDLAAETEKGIEQTGTYRLLADLVIGEKAKRDGLEETPKATDQPLDDLKGAWQALRSGRWILAGWHLTKALLAIVVGLVVVAMGFGAIGLLIVGVIRAVNWIRSLL